MKTSSESILNSLVKNYHSLNSCLKDIIKSIELLISTYKNGNKVLVCGNGGSASDAMHIVGELMKSFKLKRPINSDLKQLLNDEYLSNNLEVGLPTISLVTEASLMTAYSNDKAPDLVFAQQVLGYGKRNDLLISISTSGNSKNCVYASKVAKALNMKVISLVGKKECMLDNYSDIIIHAPSEETYRIQEYHLPIYHAICLIIEEEMFGE